MNRVSRPEGPAREVDSLPEVGCGRIEYQKNGPSSSNRMSESAIANAKIGPKTNGPRAISLSELTSTPTRANPASARSKTGGTRTARSAAVPARAAMSRSAPEGTKTER
jgi:hypothetical protein